MRTASLFGLVIWSCVYGDWASASMRYNVREVGPSHAENLPAVAGNLRNLGEVLVSARSRSGEFEAAIAVTNDQRTVYLFRDGQLVDAYGGGHADYLVPTGNSVSINNKGVATFSAQNVATGTLGVYALFPGKEPMEVVAEGERIEGEKIERLGNPSFEKSGDEIIFRAQVSGRERTFSARLNAACSTPLPRVEYYNQFDSQWNPVVGEPAIAKKPYDHFPGRAWKSGEKKFVESTIQKFGCTTSGYAMLLNAYGFTFAENEKIDPLTLNREFASKDRTLGGTTVVGGESPNATPLIYSLTLPLLLEHEKLPIFVKRLLAPRRAFLQTRLV